jgi:hypothetical protein
MQAGIAILLIGCREWSILDRDSEVLDVPFATEQFEQRPLYGADILFIVDGTASMAEEQEALATQSIAFVMALQEGWQLGVISMDLSEEGALRGIPWILTPGESAEETASQLSSMLLVGTNQLPPSAGFEAALLALDNPNNLGFRRSSAALSLIILSDADDQSTIGSQEALLARLEQEEAASGFPARISAIAGDVPNGCGSSLSGAAYLEAVEASGGVFQSICSPDFAAVADTVASGAVEWTTRFALQGVPDLDRLDEIRVLIQVFEESSIANNWSISLEEKAILEFASPPPPYATIQITYPLSP